MDLKMKLRKKLLWLLRDRHGAATFFEVAITIVIAFIIGGIILSMLSAAFKTDIMPSLIEQMKDLLTW